MTIEKEAKKLSLHACKDSDAFRLKEENEDIRAPFFRDIDRIIYSLSYTRYIDKTQVFSFNENDNITKRMVHVQFVSKIARTIGRELNLNEDLIEAGALGHDLGHVPFGHVGEIILNELSHKYNEGNFNHNVQSVRILMEVEKDGVGSNLNIQTLDAILCHNGEFLEKEYYPNPKTKNEFLNEYHETYLNQDIIKQLKPMTLEGCVIRISDMVGYLGRDIEDAIRLGVLSTKDIPKNISTILGVNNRDIVNTIVLDIIKNSYNKPYIKLSKKVFDAVKDLKDFNYKYIYEKANTEEDVKNYEKMFTTLFEVYMNHLENKVNTTDIYQLFLNTMSPKYLDNTTNARRVIDYIAGMTDDFFLSQYKKYNNKQ